MAATTTAPQTTSEQRVRLLRSMRKLEALLGETPLFAGTQPSTFTSSHSRSVSSMSSAARRCSRLFKAGHSWSIPTLPAGSHNEVSCPSRPHLVLSFPASGEPLDPAEITPPPSPLSSTFSPALAWPPLPPVDAGRRKLAKLAHTFGENVPPELVFPAATRNGRPRASTLSLRNSVLAHHRCNRRDRSDSTTSTHRASHAGQAPIPTSAVPRAFNSKARPSDVSASTVLSGASDEPLVPDFRRKQRERSDE